MSEPITVREALWLNMDRPNNLMVIDDVLWFLEQPDWDAVRGVVEERLVTRFPVFSSPEVLRRPAAYGAFQGGPGIVGQYVALTKRSHRVETHGCTQAAWAAP